jgi:hypothetical protein
MTDLGEGWDRLSPQKRALLERRLAGKVASRQSGIPRRLPDEPAPLSFSQRRLWFLEQLNPGTATYNVPFALRGRGRIDLDKFRAAINAVIGRHAVLRTAFVPDGSGEPRANVAPEWDAVKVVGIPASGDAGEAEALRLASEAAQKPFDLSHDLMLRATVFTFGSEDFIILFTTHHIAWDGISKSIFYRELARLYDAGLGNGDADLDPLPIHYADYALWQQRTFGGAVLEGEVAYWKAQLAGAPPYLDIPLDKPRPVVQRFQGSRLLFALAPETLQMAEAFRRTGETTLYTVFLAVFQVFLLAFTSQEDISISTPFACRDEPETWGMIGFFTNTVILRNRTAPNACFGDIVKQIWRTVLGAQEHHRMPMDLLAEVLHAPRDLGRMPLSQVNFRFQDGRPPELRLSGMDLIPLPLIDTLVSKFDLALQVAACEGEAGHLEYNTDLFDETRMARIPGAFEALVCELIANRGAPVENLAAFRAVREIRPKRRRIPLAGSRV